MMKVLAILAVVLSGLSYALAAQPVPSNGVIPAAGEYFLAADRTTTGMANIQIGVANVTLDLRGMSVRCNPPTPATAVTYGVKVNAGNVTVRNGKITGCSVGVHAAGSSDITIEGIDFTGSTYIGVNGGTTIRGNIFAIAGYEAESSAIAINAPGENCRIFGNTFRNLHRQPVSDPRKTGDGFGILLSAGSAGCIIAGNWFENDALDVERSIGVWVAASDSAMIRNNSFTNVGRPIAALGTAAVTDNRFWMRDPEAKSAAVDATAGGSATATGNVVIGFENAFLGTVTESDNLILP